MSPDSIPSEAVVAILGPGLLGGSLALALRKHRTATQVRVWGRRAESLDEVLQSGAADFASTDAAEVVSGASFVVLATPIVVMEEVSRAIQGALSSGAVVTDVGSVKAEVVALLEPLFASAGATFIGSHPMAGSEKTGFAAAREDLFEGARCIVTPTGSSTPEAIARVQQFWVSLGGQTKTMSPAEHDRKIARISHLPHAVAAAVVRAALGADATAGECSGPGFRDATRIAAGDPDLWTGILLANQAEVLPSLNDVAGEIRDLVEILQRLDEEALRRFLASAQILRQQLPAAN